MSIQNLEKFSNFGEKFRKIVEIMKKKANGNFRNEKLNKSNNNLSGKHINRLAEESISRNEDKVEVLLHSYCNKKQ